MTNVIEGEWIDTLQHLTFSCEPSAPQRSKIIPKTAGFR